MDYLLEDQIRDRARDILGFQDSETALSGVGQLTSWKKLGFKNVQGAPDGWYLPKVETFPAIVADCDIFFSEVDSLLKNTIYLDTQKFILLQWILRLLNL